MHPGPGGKSLAGWLVSPCGATERPDPGSQLGPAVGSRGLPTTLFYDAHGTLIDAHFGVLNSPALESRPRAMRATH